MAATASCIAITWIPLQVCKLWEGKGYQVLCLPAQFLVQWDFDPRLGFWSVTKYYIKINTKA